MKRNSKEERFKDFCLVISILAFCVFSLLVYVIGIVAVLRWMF